MNFGVPDSTLETLCEKHFRQWIPSNKFMLQIKHNCHKPFELLQNNSVMDRCLSWSAQR